MDFWHFANGYLSLIGMILLTGIVLHPRVHEGVMIKTGLMAMIISMGATAWLTLAELEDWQALRRAGFVLRAGLVCTIFGIILRARAYSKATYPHKKPGFFRSFFHG